MNRFFRSAFFPLIVIVLLVWLASQTLIPKHTHTKAETYSQLQTDIRQNPGGFDTVVFNPTGPDFREIRFDLEVSDIQHLNAVIAQLREKPVVSKVERISG